MGSLEGVFAVTLKGFSIRSILGLNYCQSTSIPCELETYYPFCSLPTTRPDGQQCRLWDPEAEWNAALTQCPHYNPTSSIWNTARYSQRSDLHPAFALRLPESPFHFTTSPSFWQIRGPIFDALRDSRFATLVLIPHVLPESGTIDADVEALARLHALLFLQLAKRTEHEDGRVDGDSRH